MQLHEGNGGPIYQVRVQYNNSDDQSERYMLEVLSVHTQSCNAYKRDVRHVFSMSKLLQYQFKKLGGLWQLLDKPDESVRDSLMRRYEVKEDEVPTDHFVRRT